MGTKVKTILIVDDEATQRRLLENIVKREGYEVQLADSGEMAFTIVQHDKNSISAVILDFSMPGMSGIELLQKLRPLKPNLPVIMLTSHSSLSVAIDAMRAGATDFLVKPTSPERIRTALASAFDNSTSAGELRPLTEKISKQLTFDQLVGAAPNFLSTVATARKAATASIPVLIEGESGVGKELIAQSIHSASPRKNKPFIVVNCGAIPANLIESILFGHEKGAFTGAIDKHDGKFSEANGGTVFLDEIGEMPLEAQVKLLRFLQEGEVEAVGSRTTRKVDVRVLSATNRTLANEVEAGRFREDLYYRLNVVSLRIPSLRSRRDDIAKLAQHFLETISSEQNIAVRTIDSDAITLLTRFDWPGNVRQLQNAIFRAVVLCDGETLTLDDFPQLQAQADATGLLSVTKALPTRPMLPTNAVPLVKTDGHIRKLEEFEADILRHSVTLYHGKMTEIAKRLGISRSTLYRKLSELGISEGMNII